MDLTPYVCKQCGGQIDISTMKCPYCGTAYTDPSLKQIKVIKVRPGEHILGAETRIDQETMMSVDPETLRDYTLKELSHQLADGLLAYMKISTCKDYMHFTEIIRGEVRVIDPMFTD